MKKEYDFRKAKIGAIEPTPSWKTRITIRLDAEVIDWFRNQVELKGGGNYQTMINNTLRDNINNVRQNIEDIVRRVIREEIKEMSVIRNIYIFPESAINRGIRSDIPFPITPNIVGSYTEEKTQ